MLVLFYAYIMGHRLPPLRDVRWIWYFAMAITGASLPFVLIANGQQTVDSGITAIIVGTMPLITIILAHFFTTEKLNRWKLTGFLMGFIGIIILFLPKDLSWTLVADWPAQLLILAGSRPRLGQDPEPYSPQQRSRACSLCHAYAACEGADQT